MAYKVQLTNKVAHSTDLYLSMYEMDTTTMRLFEIVLSCINDFDVSKDNNIIYLDKNQIFDMFGYTDTNRYTLFRDRMGKLATSIVRIKGKRRETIYTLATKVTWSLDDDDSAVQIKLNHELMPYLIDLKTHFVQYELKETVYMQSSYAIILFKYLINLYNQKGYNVQFNDLNIPLEVLKDWTDTKKKKSYDRFTNWEVKVLRKAVDEINKLSSYIFSYEKKKKGRKIVSIQFDVKPKNSDGQIDIFDVID